MIVSREGAPGHFLELLLPGAAVLPLTLILLKILKRISYSAGILDHPGARKFQVNPVPLLGGVPFLLSFATGSLYLIVARSYSSYYQFPSFLWGMIAGGGLIFLTGFFDDIFKDRFPLQIKLLGQVLSLFTAIVLGIRFDLFHHGFFDALLTFFWLFWLTNAINMLDNIDGLSGGCCLFILGAMVAHFHLNGIYWGFFLTLILFFSLVGFLLLNFPPSSIYMGDSGSLLLGFLLASFSFALISSEHSGITKSLSKGALFLALFVVPLVDTLFVVLRRIYSRKPVYVGDRNHLSHDLLGKGLSIYKVLVVFYLISIITSLVSFVIYFF